jgi:hypothetical protein
MFGATSVLVMMQNPYVQNHSYSSTNDNDAGSANILQVICKSVCMTQLPDVICGDAENQFIVLKHNGGVYHLH